MDALRSTRLAYIRHKRSVRSVNAATSMNDLSL